MEGNEEERSLMYKQMENLLEAAIINTDYFEQVTYKCLPYSFSKHLLNVKNIIM